MLKPANSFLIHNRFPLRSRLMNSIFPPCVKEADKPYYCQKVETVCTEMIDFKQINNLQHLFVFREALLCTGIDQPMLQYLGSQKINKQKYAQLTKHQQHWRWLINYFYQVKSSITSVYYHRLSRYIDDFIPRVSHLLYDAYGLGGKTLDTRYRTSDVMAMLKGMRQTMDISSLPIFADALQDAGFGNNVAEAKILDNYRSNNPKSLGSWIFRAAGVL